MVKPYCGNDPYIFISYSHKDSAEVLSVVEVLQNDGYNVWYDEGIDPGTEWDDNIAEHVENCNYFLAFMSVNYIDSDNCMDELSYARDLKKNRLLVYLSDVKLTGGTAMRHNRLQAIHKYKYTDMSEFKAKLYSTYGINECCSAAKTQPVVAPQPESKNNDADVKTDEVTGGVSEIGEKIADNYVEQFKGKDGEFEYFYTGEMFNGKRHGRGRNVWSDGDIYDGFWKEDRRCGYGRCVFSDETIYEGEWKDNKRHGYGKEVWCTGIVYEGEFFEDKRHGQGKMIYSDGKVYNGEWKDDVINGQGKMTYPDGSVYEGEWFKGIWFGYGVRRFANGSVYEGEFQNGQYHGQGKMTYIDGDIYEGNWRDGRPSGQGKMTHPDGRVEAGIWSKGRKIK